MSTTSSEQAKAQQADVDPFRYGWRYVKREHADGRVEFEQVPLTLRDVLHPEEGDFIMQTIQHHEICEYLFAVFRARVASDPHALVASDLRIAWDVPGLKAHGPDVCVIFDVQMKPDWSTFDVGEEGTRPALIVEVTSPDTRVNDVVAKVEHYDLAGVPFYIIVDIVERRGQPKIRLIGYQQIDGFYQPLPADARGWLWLEPVRLWLGVNGDGVACYDEHSKRIGDYVELDQQLSEAEQRAQQAAQQAEAERLAREAALQQAEAERQARAQAQHEAQEAAQQAEAERLARAQAQQQAQQAAQQAEAERQARAQAQHEAQEAAQQAEAERLAREAALQQAEAERQARAQAQQQAQQAAQQAEAERLAREVAERRAADVEARLQALEAQIRKLQAE